MQRYISFKKKEVVDYFNYISQNFGSLKEESPRLFERSKS